MNVKHCNELKLIVFKRFLTFGYYVKVKLLAKSNLSDFCTSHVISLIQDWLWYNTITEVNHPFTEGFPIGLLSTDLGGFSIR
jgi:hypothetical protein